MDSLPQRCPKVQVTCRTCGQTWEMLTRSLPLWSGYCRPCRPLPRDPVTCKDCGKTWMFLRLNLAAWEGRCRSCAYKHRFRDPAYLARHRDNARQTVAAQGGIPNRKVFTPERVRGAANHKWKGGVTPEHARIRGSEEYKAWRRAVFARDAFTCRDCGRKGGWLQAHHILPFATHLAGRFRVGNGLTLCRPCHRLRHTKGQP